nr:hypothetical protein [Tanacetum cinerariifolium]
MRIERSASWVKRHRHMVLLGEGYGTVPVVCRCTGRVVWDEWVETSNEGTKILTTVDGKLITISESSIRRNLKLKDETGISSLPDAEIFKNLTLMGYNISPNQKFTFQKGQFSHQWKYLIHTIMQCLSPKSPGFNEFSSNIATAVVCLATNRVYNFLKMIFDGMVRNVNNKVSKFLTYPRFLSKCFKMGQFRQITHNHMYAVPFHTRKVFTTLRVNSPNFSRRTVPLFDTMLVTMGEGSGTPTEPHHTPSLEVPQSPQHDLSSSIHPPVTTVTIPTVIPTETLPLRQYTKRARIAQSSALPAVVDEPASPLGDDSQCEAFPTVSGLEAKHDRANIIKTSALPSDSTPKVTSLTADEGKISTLKARIKLLEDRDRGGDDPSGEDATIKGRSLETGEEAGIERSTDKGSNDTEEMVNVLTSLDATSILTSGVQVSVPPAAEVATVSILLAGEIPTVIVPTGSGVVPTASPIFTTAIVATPYLRRKGKEKMVEPEMPKKKKLQEQMDVQMARQLEEEMVRDAQRMNEQIVRDAEIARIHAEEELQMLIDGLDKNNETVAKYLQEYKQFAADLSIRERIELINDLVKYQDNYAKVLKYQSQQRKPLSKKQQREFYMSVLRSHAGWKTKHFKEMSLEEIREKFVPVWKQIKDFVPIGSKEEGERFKRKGLRLEQDSAKKVKTSEEVSEEDLKTMMQLVPVEEVYVEALQKEYPLRKGLAIVMISNKLQVENYSQMASDLIQKIYKIANSPRQRSIPTASDKFPLPEDFSTASEERFPLLREDLNQLWTLVKETLSIRQATSDREKEIWVKLKRLFEPDFEDQLWTHTQALMHDPVEWKLYDSCGVHHVLTRDQEIFMLVEKDYPL